MPTYAQEDGQRIRNIIFVGQDSPALARFIIHGVCRHFFCTSLTMCLVSEMLRRNKLDTKITRLVNKIQNIYSIYPAQLYPLSFSCLSVSTLYSLKIGFLDTMKHYCVDMNRYIDDASFQMIQLNKML